MIKLILFSALLFNTSLYALTHTIVSKTAQLTIVFGEAKPFSTAIERGGYCSGTDLYFQSIYIENDEYSRDYLPALNGGSYFTNGCADDRNSNISQDDAIDLLNARVIKRHHYGYELVVKAHYELLSVTKDGRTRLKEKMTFFLPEMDTPFTYKASSSITN